MTRQPQLLFGVSRFAGFPIAAVTAMLLACSDPLPPSQLSGLYRLRLTNGHAPPEVVDTTTTSQKLYLRTGLLLIKSSGEDTLLARMDHGSFIGFTYDYGGTYKLSGQRLTFATTRGDGSTVTYTGGAGPQTIDVQLPFTVYGTYDLYTVVVNTHFEQVCAGDQCNFNSDGPPWIRE